jgi:zinc protease
MTLVVVGDVDLAALAAKLDELLGAWKPKGKKPAGAKLGVQKPKTLIYLVDRPGAEQADVRLGVVSITPKDKTAPAIEVLGNVLGGTFTSRLNRRLREELGWTYGARAGQRSWTGKSPFVISTALVTPHAVEGVAEVLKIVATLVDGDLPADELTKAQQNLIRDLPTSFATNRGMVASFAALVRLGLPDDHYAGYATRVQKVTAKQVRAVAKTLLGKGKLVIVVIGDAAVLRPGLEALGLGPVQLTSPEGKPL